MYITTHGTFNGTSWEEFCQICFKKKYEADGYQEMPAWQGDLGIEGFTRTGILFQCYCPNEEYTPDKLYEEQRNKITEDLGKLVKNETKLKDYLKEIKAKQWIFVTPGYKKKDIVRHCREKAEEYRKLNLSILSDDFDVLIYDIDFFSEEIPIVLNYRNKKLEIIPNEKTTDADIADWKSTEIPLVENAIRKHGQRISSNANERDNKINTLTQISIEHFLTGNGIIKIMQDSYPKDYEKFIRVVSNFETKVTEMCIVNSRDNNELLKEISNELESRLNESFNYLEQVVIHKLKEQVLADWILRCPINFE